MPPTSTHPRARMSRPFSTQTNSTRPTPTPTHANTEPLRTPTRGHDSPVHFVLSTLINANRFDLLGAFSSPWHTGANSVSELFVPGHQSLPSTGSFFPPNPSSNHPRVHPRPRMPTPAHARKHATPYTSMGTRRTLARSLTHSEMRKKKRNVFDHARD